MIDVKTAVNSAYQYLEFMQDKISDQLEDLRLEEVELSDDRHFWLVTLGYDLPSKNRSQLEEILTPTIAPKKVFRREYKILKVNSEMGEVEAMKIRPV